MRDLDKTPYNPDERRVCEYIQKITDNQIGCGDDPIGFLIAAHSYAISMLKQPKEGMKKLPDFMPEGMKHSDFQIGLKFRTGAGRWCCTDVGQRTITAIYLGDREPEDLNGPPYSIPEHVFDEYDFGGCSKERGVEK